MSYEKDKIDSFITSASASAAIATALLPYVTSNSLSAAIAGLNLAPYMTSNSISAAVTTNTLTVRGAASVSATMSAAAVTVASRPVGAVLLGVDSGVNKTTLAFSGSWSDFPILEIHSFAINTTGTLPTAVFTDGGTTPILSMILSTSVAGGSDIVLESRVYGGDGQSHKALHSRAYVALGLFAPLSMTVTANTGFVNCIRISLTGTASYAFSALYGWRKT